MHKNPETDSWVYDNALKRVNEWRDTIRTAPALGLRASVIEVLPHIESHEQYSERVDVTGRLKKFRLTLPFAHIGLIPRKEGNTNYDLFLPLSNSVILGTKGSRKTYLVSAIARAFLQFSGPDSLGVEAYDVLYVNFKHAEKANYEELPEEKNEAFWFHYYVRELANVDVIPIRYTDLLLALQKEPRRGVGGRCFYTELRSPAPDPLSELMKLLNQKGSDRGLFLILDEFMAAAGILDGNPRDKGAMGFIKTLRNVSRTHSLRFAILGQELSYCWVAAGEKRPEEEKDKVISEVRRKGMDEIRECSVILGCQNEANKQAYQEFLNSRLPSGEMRPLWNYDFEAVTPKGEKKKVGLDLPIGPFFLFPCDDEHLKSYPVPGSIPLQREKKPEDVARDIEKFIRGYPWRSYQ